MAVTDNTDGKEPIKILGMPKYTFYGAAGIVTVLIGYGLYEIFKKK